MGWLPASAVPTVAINPRRHHYTTEVEYHEPKTRVSDQGFYPRDQS